MDTLIPFVLFALLLGIGIALFVGYIQLLATAAESEHWGWFVLMLVFWPTALLYLLTDPPSSASTGSLERRLRERDREVTRLERRVRRLEAGDFEPR